MSGRSFSAEPAYSCPRYRTVVMPIGSLWQASSELLRFGVDAEVLAPPELRRGMGEITVRLRERYRADEQRGDVA